MYPNKDSLDLAVEILDRQNDEAHNTYNVANQRTSTYLGFLAVLSTLLGVFIQQLLGNTAAMSRLFPAATFVFFLRHPIRGILVLGIVGLVAILFRTLALALSALKPVTFQTIDNEAIDVALKKGYERGAEIYVRDMMSVIRANKEAVRRRLSLQLKIGRWVVSFVVVFVAVGLLLFSVILFTP